MCLGNQGVAGVRNTWCAGVGNQCDVVAALESAEDCFYFFWVAVAVHGHELFFGEVELLDKVSCNACIFTDDGIALAQGLFCAVRDVPEVADGGGDNRQHFFSFIIRKIRYDRRVPQPRLCSLILTVPMAKTNDENTDVPEENPAEEQEDSADTAEATAEQEDGDAGKPEQQEMDLGTAETLADVGHVSPRPIVQEMEESYLDYAMSVIVARALPDARDGLKPVHRRILFSMHELGLRSSAKFRKSALVVGDVLGKYHPHGDTAVYDALVRMAQDFSMRYPLVKGQGNFGSIDGDGAAAMRYTESKMERISDEILSDIEKDTVDFHANYDDSRKEPTVLPSKIPSLLLNGTVGIAVGMATNIPPHNLGELIDAVLHLLENEDASVPDLLKFVKGPDFTTGGIVYNKESLKQAYLTGRGSVVVRGKAEIEEMKSGRFQIIVTEIPYQVNKSNMIEKVARLVQEKTIQGVSDIRDASDRDGIRVVVALKRAS